MDKRLFKYKIQMYDVCHVPTTILSALYVYYLDNMGTVGIATHPCIPEGETDAEGYLTKATHLIAGNVET